MYEVFNLFIKKNSLSRFELGDVSGPGQLHAAQAEQERRRSSSHPPSGHSASPG